MIHAMNHSLCLTTSSPEETLSVAEDIGRKARPGDIIALYGDLGSGKTVMAKGIALGLDITDNVTSPTFTLMEVYRGRHTLYHFDLYRINSPGEFENLFFEEYWEGDGISVIEWPEKAESLLPKKRIDILIEYIDENRRKITIEYTGD